MRWDIIRYIHAVKMCNEQQLTLKKVGYLTTALVLDEDHELIILIINTLQQDLRSDNHLVGACRSTTALCLSAPLTRLRNDPLIGQPLATGDGFQY